MSKENQTLVTLTLGRFHNNGSTETLLFNKRARGAPFDKIKSMSETSKVI